MEAFLQKIATHIYASHGEKLSRLCLVFPNRRAGLFLNQYLSRMISKPVWLPDIYTIEDFVIHKSGLSLSDPLSLIVRLYKVYKSLAKDKAQPFSEFVPWGNMLLSDFDEIDQYQADGKKVFAYIDEIKALQHWNPDGKPLTEFEKNYLDFFNSLAPCYSLFRNQLLENKEGYLGLAFNQLLNEISINSFTEWDKILFAGFNALTKAEEELIGFLLGNGKAEIFWDTDDYYMSDERQEAGRFLRKYAKSVKFGVMNPIGNALKTKEKNIKVIGVPGNVGQAKLAGELCHNLIKKKGSGDGIAIVLVNENLLLPVLNSIPAEACAFNITMGLPLKQTPVYQLINCLVTLFVNAKRFSNDSQDNPDQKSVLRFYHKDIKRLLLHPYIVRVKIKVRPENSLDSDILVEHSFYSAIELLSLIEKYYGTLTEVFGPHLRKKLVQPSDIVQLIRDLLYFLKNCFSQDTETLKQFNSMQPIDIEYLYHAAQICSKLEIIAGDPELNPDIETMQAVLNGLMGGIRLPFYGEPLNGLQVMGMLETRLLDFSDIILISANEGLLPKGKHQSTFIPDEVRTAFGMQRYIERTAVFAYHFYRLLQQVENAWLLYSTEGDELGGGEMSRFMAQLLHELPLANPNAKITQHLLSVVPAKKILSGISVAKTPEINDRLLQIASKGISPTALSTYLRCGLQFYYSQVLGISQPDEVAESIDAASLGDIVHEALYNSYNSYTPKLITAESFDSLIAFAIQQIKTAAVARYNEKELTFGKNLLILKVAENMVKRFLNEEKKFIRKTNGQIEILHLEDWLKTSLNIIDSSSGETIPVKIHGKVDRIDRIGGVTRIIDYKTGNVESKELRLDEIGDILDRDDRGKLFQVLIYALLFADNQTISISPMESGIISLRHSSLYLIKSNIGGNETIDNNLLKEFRTLLISLISRIFDTTVPFDPTDNVDTCKICAFKLLCNREIN